jgi:hypothetical protein
MTKHERRASKDDAWVDILVANHSRRTGNMDADFRRPGGPRARNGNRPDPQVASKEVAEVLAGIRGPSPGIPLDEDSEADIGPMTVPHRSMIDGHGASLDEIYARTIPGSVSNVELEPEPMLDLVVDRVEVRPPRRPSRRIGYFDIHPERPLSRIDPDIDPRDQIVRSLAESDGETGRRSDVTESVYSAGANTPPASPPKHLLPELTAVKIPDEATPTASPQTLVYSPRDLQRQQEVRDRLSGKPGPKASSLIELYREKERQASSGNSPGRSSSITTTTPATAVYQQRSAQAAKESLPLPPRPPSPPTPGPALQSEPSPSPPETPTQVIEEAAEDEEYMEPPNLELDQGRESPFRYVHGASLHNVVEEEEEE